MTVSNPESAFVPRHGRRRATFPDPRDYKVVSVRLRAAEFESFSEQIREFGLTSNMALRIAARRISGFLEIDANTRGNLEEITKSIGVISDAINEVHKLAVNSGTVDMQVFDEIRVAFGQEFAALDSLLRKILNVSRRRQDGVSVLTNAPK